MTADILNFLMPPELSAAATLGLIGVSFLTSAMTVIAGIGGGLTMIAVLASFLPPVAVLPLHGVVQIGSNAGRALLMRHHIDFRIVGFFTLGSLLGVTVGGSIFVVLPPDVLRIVLGIFILYLVWGPKLRRSEVPPKVFAVVGAVTSFATMFVGGTGSFVAPFFSPEKMGRKKLVGTHAGCMSVQHSLKVVAFGFIGFHFLPWLPFLAAMVLSGFIGTYVGRHFLGVMPERLFAVIFRSVLTVLALRLLYVALSR
jgi:uncharacterized membrane protein YfcA